MSNEEVNEIVAAVVAKYEADVVAYFGDIASPYDEYLTYWSTTRVRHHNIVLILQTLGGDPHAAYRIARCFQRAYQTLSGGIPNKLEKKGSFIVFINSRCKSAGTLLTLGADRIVMSETAELGPIDVQLRNPEEVGERTSGLTPTQAVQFLETQSTALFKRHFRSLRFSEDLAFSTRMSAEIATNVTVGLLAPIYQQIDPVRLAEVDRSLRIASDYGERIGKSNLKPKALERLLAGYPSHNFVIDREEAGEIFQNVEEPSEELRRLAQVHEPVADYYETHGTPFCFFLNDQMAREEKTPEGEQKSSESDRVVTHSPNGVKVAANGAAENDR